MGDTPVRAAAGSDDSRDVRTPVRFGGHDLGLGGRLAAAQVASVAAVHETFARLAAESLAGRTCARIAIRTHSVTQLRGDEFHRQLPRAALLAGVALDPLPGVASLALDQRAAFALLDLLLGGRGVPSVPARAPSDLEHSLLRNWVAGLLPQLRSAWQPLARIRPRLAYCGPREQASAVPAPTGMVVRVAFSAAVGGVEGELQLALPCRALKSIRARAPAAAPPQPQEASAETGCQAARHAALQAARVSGSAEIGSALLPVDLRMTVELGSTTRTIREVLAMHEGSVIELDQLAGEPVAILVNRQPIARGEVVVIDDNFGVRVTEIVGRAEPVPAPPAES